MDIGPGTLLFVIFVVVVGYFVYRIFRLGGLKAAMFGARIERTVGEVPGEKQGLGLMSVVLRVHALRRDNSEMLIGIELVAKSFASYQMMPITLSVHQAQQLASLLQNATSTHQAHST
jgi:hypothetical protein